MSSEVAAALEAEEGLVGRVIAGKYRVDRLLGRGGMGSVFQATNLSIGKRVALKFLNRDAARDPDATERFQREALAASVVESSHIVQIFDSGTSEDGLPFLVMEMLTGEDLRARLSREGRLPVEAAAAVAVQLLRALVRAHAAGIVHRDLKPDNVFLCERDDGSLYVKIVDFGVSKLARSAKLDTLTGRGTVLGTAFYMSPEQAQAFSDVDGRTDLFSVGAILYECLAARPPHVAPTYEAVLIAICTKQAEDIRSFAPDVPRSVADVIHRALATDRSQRYASAQAMLDALSAALPSAMLPRTDSSAHGFGSSSQEAISGELSTFSSTSRAPSLQQNRARTAVTAGLFVLAGFAIAAWWAGSRRQSHVPVSVSEGSPSAKTSAALVAPPAPSVTPAVVVNTPPPVPAASASASATNASVNAMPAKRVSHGTPRPQPKAGNPKGVGQGLELSTREP